MELNDIIKLSKDVTSASFSPSFYVNDYKLVKRSWKERLFSIPWEPFTKTKSVYSPSIYIVSGNYIVSYQTYDVLIKEGLFSGN